MKLIVSNNSPNHFNGRKDSNGKVWKADIIVFHQTGGNELAPAMRWYLNPNAQCSPNWLIDTDGTIYQLVDPDNAAWCNGTSLNAGDNKYYGYALSSIVRSRKANANLYSLSAEFVHCQWGNITEAQKTAAVELIKNVIIPYMKKNGVMPVIDRTHVIGHSEVTPKTRDPEKLNCPGKQFPFDEIIQRVNGAIVTDKGHFVQYIYKSVSQAAIRPEMSKNSAVLDRVIKGDYYPIDTIYGGIWLKHAGQKAYSMLKDGGSLFTKVGEYTTKRTTTTLNVRQSPSLTGHKMTVLQPTTIVYIWGEKPIRADGYDWAKIVIEGKIGYVAAKYLK